MANLRLGKGNEAEQLEDRKGLLSSFDNIRREVDASGTMAGMDSFTTKALEMVTSGKVRGAAVLVP